MIKAGMMKELKSAMELVIQLAYFTLRLCTIVLQKVIHRINGVADHHQRIASGSEMDTVVHVNSILAKLPFLGLSVANYYHFLLWHQEFVTLDYLLKPNITMYFIDGKNAVFLEYDPAENIYDSRKFPFYFIAQRLTATKLLVVPMSQLLVLGQKLDKPKSEVTWICHMARCGSTTLVQGLNAVPGCVVISESQELMMHLAEKSSANVVVSDYVKTAEFKRILEASVRYLLKNFTEGQKVCVKTTASFAYTFMGHVAELFPGHKFISMHRDGHGTANSFYRMGSNHTLLLAGIRSFQLFPNLLRKHIERFITIFCNGLQSEIIDLYSGENLNLFVFFYIQWVTNVVTFQRSKGMLPHLMTIAYHDFHQDKKGTTMKVFDYMGLSMADLPAAMKAMETDSQAGTALSWEALKGCKSWQRDEKTVQLCTQILDRFNLPSFDTKFRFNENHEIEAFAES